MDGIVLPEGSDPQALAGKMLTNGMMGRPEGPKLCDEIFCLPVGEQEPTDWDAILADYPPDRTMRALVEHGTPGAVSLDMCPYGTLITTAAEMRQRVGEGLQLMSLQPQRV